MPAGFTRPNASYKRNAWLAVAGLVLFIVLYLALAAWFAFVGISGALRLISGASSGVEFIACGASLFLAVFLVKALFFIRKGETAADMELTRAEQPRLFAFLDQIADDAGAPRPHRVFVSGRVNAAVFYDLSLVNLILPSHKNLEIGLGLVNMLNLSEFKAVCAHEFGHFAQRSMALGRWVYTTQQIAAHIVAKRDALDRFLRWLSRFDIRVAWIGWLLSGVVWALRAIVDTAFRLVVIAQRALSREMEMQADLVAVSLTGSDALVHALHRLQIADDAWDRTLNFMRGEVGNQRPPRDVFAVHQAFAERLNRIYNDPSYGQRPRVPAEGASAFRVFNGELAQPPRMWATHPQNHEREANAKRTYLSAPTDERSAWALFDHAQDLRERMTSKLAGEPEHPVVELDATLHQLDAQFKHEHLKPQYRGIYLGRSAVRHARLADELVDTTAPIGSLQLEALYPPSLNHNLERLRALDREHALLCSLRDRVYDAPDGVIRHRGRVLKRAELPAAIAVVDTERAEARTAVASVLKNVRSAHVAAAQTLSSPWQAYLRGLLNVLHYADHTETTVRDAQALLSTQWQRAAAGGGPINEKGVGQILNAAQALQLALARVFQLAHDVHPGAPVLAELGIENWADTLGSFGLEGPVRGNINDWLRTVDSWVDHAAGWLSALRRTTLDTLLRTEAMVAAAHAGSGGPLPEAPQPAPSAPAAYDTVMPGEERTRHIDRPDFWERFRTANGLLPGFARAAVALGIVGSVLVFGWTLGRATISIYNALARPVVTTVDGQRVELPPGGVAHVSVDGGGEAHIVTATQDGDPIETFDAPLSRLHTQFVYTVAGAAPLRQWTAVYGKASAEPPRLLPPQRWQPTSAEFVFNPPPQSIQAKGGGTRTVLDAGTDTSPDELVEPIQDRAAATAMLLSHVRYDAPDSAYLQDWLALASKAPGFAQALAARLARFPSDVVALRMEQSVTEGAAHDTVCARQRARAAAAPDQPDLAYLATRCMPPGEEQDAAFEAGHQRWPESAWYANAAGWHASLQGRYVEALVDYQAAIAKSPALRHSLAIETARLMRLVDPATAKPRVADLAKASTPLQELLQLEPDMPVPEGPYRAIALLSAGRLDDAVAAAAGTSLAGHVLRMAAGSVGASPALRARAAALAPGDGVDAQTVWLALAAGEPPTNGKIAVILKALEHSHEGLGTVARMQRFLALAGTGNTAAAEVALDGVPPYFRAQALAAGTALLRDRAPPAWRTFAKRVLFSAERPYLGEG